ncbi:protein FAM221A-like [Lissotriton helveticus]
MSGKRLPLDKGKAPARPRLQQGQLAPQGPDRPPDVEGQAEAVQAYLEYRRIVGDDDQGKLFTPQEYEEYKKRVIPIRLRNRLYVSWRSPTGMDCKLVGPETPCFCTHRYKQHKTDFEELPTERPIPLPCKVRRCQCRGYLYVPLNGTSPIRCRCKHFADDHSEANDHRCRKCSTCPGFHSSFTCGCGKPAYVHQTVVETKEERLAQGKPVGLDVPYIAMGGLTGFSSLADGYMRLDDSGRGALPLADLESTNSRMDHPFLKAYGPQVSGAPSSAVSQGRTKEDDDMAYFEKRYQERLKKEKTSKGLKPAKGPPQPGLQDP